MSNKLWQKLARRLGLWEPPKKKFCVLCNQAVVEFSPYCGGSAAMSPFVRQMDVVGSDIDHWACPVCNAHDRERHLLLYLKQLRLLDRFRGASVLHFAPEKRLSPILRALHPERYLRADLFPAEPDVARVDMLDISLPDASIDVVIANHVLEHVSDDRRALRELHRVLKPGGIAILQTPYSARLHSTFEDAGIDDDASRLFVYGQEDHVRLYGRDIFDRLAECGLRPDIHTHDDTLAEFDPVKYGLNRAEPLFLFRRT